MSEQALRVVAPGVWSASEPVRIVGMKLTTSMTVLAMPDGELLLHSPIAMTAARREAVTALGRVAHLYAPNTYHHLWIEEWARSFPDARVHAPAALATKRPALRIDRAHDAGRDPALDRVFDEIHIDGFRLEECVLVHRPSATLVVADLVHHIGRPPGAWTKLYTSAMGFYDRVALSRAIRWAGFSDRRAARVSVDAVLERSFDRVVVGHGDPIEHDAHAALADAYAWLQPTSGRALVPGRLSGSSACG